MATRGQLGAVDDLTPLNGPQVDVAARLGWTVRMARVTGVGAHVHSLERMARAAGTNSVRLHRLETGRLRDGRLADHYTDALGLPPGSLRAATDILCRTFPREAPIERAPTLASDVHAVSDLTERLLAGGGDGGQWFEWARHLSRPGAVGLPIRIAAELVQRLMSEMSRSVGTAYPTRYEALSLLRCGPYGDVVLDVARSWVGDPEVQVLADVMSAVCELSTPAAVTWTTTLLDDPREQVMVAGALGLENLAAISVSPRAIWESVGGGLVERYNDSTPGTTRWEWFSHLLRLLPDEVLVAQSVRPQHRPAPVVQVQDWSRSRLNEHWTDCSERAKVICAELGLPEQPMLARLLFDIAVSPRETRGVTSGFLLGVLPPIAAAASEQLAEMAEDHPDEVVRDRAARRLAGCQLGFLPARTAGWLRGGSPLRLSALRLLSCAGRPIDSDVVAKELTEGGRAVRSALYAVGMTDSRWAASIASDQDTAVEVRGAAGWWVRHGERVVDPPPDPSASS